MWLESADPGILRGDHMVERPLDAERLQLLGARIVGHDGQKRAPSFRVRKELDRVLHLLRDANVLGVVVNRQKSSIPQWVQRSLGLGA